MQEHRRMNPFSRIHLVATQNMAEQGCKLCSISIRRRLKEGGKPGASVEIPSLGTCPWHMPLIFKPSTCGCRPPPFYFISIFASQEE